MKLVLWTVAVSLAAQGGGVAIADPGPTKSPEGIVVNQENGDRDLGRFFDDYYITDHYKTDEDDYYYANERPPADTECLQYEYRCFGGGSKGGTSKGSKSKGGKSSKGDNYEVCRMVCVLPRQPDECCLKYEQVCLGGGGGSNSKSKSKGSGNCRLVCAIKCPPPQPPPPVTVTPRRTLPPATPATTEPPPPVTVPPRSTRQPIPSPTPPKKIYPPPPRLSPPTCLPAANTCTIPGNCQCFCACGPPGIVCHPLQPGGGGYYSGGGGKGYYGGGGYYNRGNRYYGNDSAEGGYYGNRGYRRRTSEAREPDKTKEDLQEVGEDGNTKNEVGREARQNENGLGTKARQQAIARDGDKERELGYYGEGYYGGGYYDGGYHNYGHPGYKCNCQCSC